MDFYQIKEREVKKGVLEVYPDFKVVRSKDLMVRAKSFYAIWDEEAQLWSTDEYDVQRLVDAEIAKHEIYSVGVFEVVRKYLGNFSSNSWLQFRNYMSHLTDNSHQLDDSLTFRNTVTKKTDYVSRRLDYDLKEGDISAWDELVSFLYEADERAKIEWAIGAVVSGDSKTIQKFLTFYGSAGTGKSTILNIIEKLFKGYVATFDAKAMTGANNSFAMEVLRNNPLVLIQHDGDLSKIVDNTKFNSMVSHEIQQINEKHKPSYDAASNGFPFIGTNTPVKITDAKSGIIRRLIDVQPTGLKLPPRKYAALYSQIDFELGAIAHHCLEVYREMGKNYYETYKPIEMMLQTDIYFNFIEEHIELFTRQDGVTLKQAYDLYKAYCDDSHVEYVAPRFKFREELKNYFHHFEERAIVDDVRVRSWYSGFITDKFTVQKVEDKVLPLVFDEVESLLDERYAEYKAQYANAHDTPLLKWDEVDTKLSDLNTRDLHFVAVPPTEICIDFDLKDEDGNKSLELNLEAASHWPPTYGELSQGGAGVHLHYEWVGGDPALLKRVHSDGIEVKVYTGKATLRRRLTKCNNIPVAKLDSGLETKEKSKVNPDGLKTEKSIRNMIDRNLRKEIHPGTKPSIDFIHKILEDAYLGGVTYDVTDMRPVILAFAAKSSNQAMYCMKRVQGMRFHSEPTDVSETDTQPTEGGSLAFYDVEVFPNLFIVCWKLEDKIDSFGIKHPSKIIRMINPSPQAMEELMSLKLVGYNCRRYDNHIIYARYMGYSNEQLYMLSKKIINNDRSGMFAEAYDLSYADIYDYASEKKSLKKWQIELGLTHKELGLDWDTPVPEELWETVAEYCDNDVISTEQVHIARKQDFIARQILADLSGLKVNASTQQHASRIIFGSDRRPQEKFNYTDLREEFPGYEFDKGKSTYKGEETGEGGYVYAEPGMYTNVALLDVASMHPRSIEMLDLFGDYTKNFSAIKAARLAIKRKDYEEARKMLDGKLARYLTSEDDAEALSDALKIVINSVYGLTAAKFDNTFRDPRNIDNIVAKRGALFMVDLKLAVQEQGFTVVHIKTDSIKIANATEDIIDFVMNFGDQYGYEFEHEATFEKITLVNDAVYIGYKKKGRKPAHWDAVGAQFQHPYVFKTMFTKEKVEFRDLCETKQVSTAMYLDFAGEDTPMALENKGLRFVGKAGLFTPIEEGFGGGELLRAKEDGFSAVTGTKGYRWMESHMVEPLGLLDHVDMDYFKKLVDAAYDQIDKYGDAEWFVS